MTNLFGCKASTTYLNGVMIYFWSVMTNILPSSIKLKPINLSVKGGYTSLLKLHNIKIHCLCLLSQEKQ